jgi:hypothetical protein
LSLSHGSLSGVNRRTAQTPSRLPS